MATDMDIDMDLDIGLGDDIGVQDIEIAPEFEVSVSLQSVYSASVDLLKLCADKPASTYTFHPQRYVGC